MAHATLNTARRIALCLAAGLAIALPQIAHAQTALGTGRGLEKDLRKGGNGNTRGRDFGAEVRLRNALVTGNASDGRSLRITPPYSDPDDFQDTLGSTDIFTFRRDSLYSGLGGQGYRGMEGLQYQFGMSTGGGIAIPGLYVGRTNTAAGEVPQSLSSPNPYSPTRLSSKSWEVVTPVNGAMRSTASFNSTRNLTPTAVGLRQMQNGDQVVIAASNLLGLRGVTIESRNNWEKPLGVVDAPKEEVLGDANRAPTAIKPSTNPLAAQPVGTRRETGQASNKVTEDTAIDRSAYDNLRVRLDAYGRQIEQGTDAKKTPGADGKSDGSDSKEGTKPSTKPSTAPDFNPRALPGDPNKPKTDAPGTDGAKPGTEEDAAATGTVWDRRVEMLRKTLGTSPDSKEAPAALDAVTIRAIRMAGQDSRTTTAVSPQVGQTNAFTDNCLAAEKLMSEGRYFDAEERFTRAITVRPGDPNALAGRINAQLGSGLLVSAAMNLRTLIMNQPDAVGMLFGDNLLPSKARQDELLSQLRTNIAIDNKPQIRVPKESALLLAYLGYQRSETAAIREGLSAFRKLAGTEDGMLVTFLEGVWLGEETPAPAPAAAPK